MKKRKFSYIKIKDEPKKQRKKNDKVWRSIGHVMTVVGTTISSMLLILVIMLCIVATVIVVYVLDFANSYSFDYDLKESEKMFTTMVYAYDKEGQEVELKRLSIEANRIWVDYKDISPNIINAVVAKEDKRFYTHKGVDWQRTVFALVMDVIPNTRSGEGGSTITQQLVKNITKDDAQTWERKLREIFRAMSLEERYTKEDILECYLNKIAFGGMVYGVEAACQTYFGKSASEVTIAEAAIIAGIIKDPRKNPPTSDLTRCREAQLTALYAMYEQGFIRLQEYEDAKAEQVKFVPVVHGDDFGYVDPRSIATEEPEEPEETEPAAEPQYEAYKWNDKTYEVSQSWYTDAAIRQVIDDYAELRGITYTSARNEIYNGGYKIYTNVDLELQAIVEEKYSDPYLIMISYDKNIPEKHLTQSAFVLMDYSGTVLALAGGLGEKQGDNCFNRATMAMRSPGSTMKPISPYAVAIQNNLITYSTMFPDRGIPVDFQSAPWPSNYNGHGGKGELIHAWYAVRHSTNTFPIRLTTMITPQVLYNHLTQNLGFTTLVAADIAPSPLTLGALTDGIKIIELTAAYQIFGNGGVYYEPKLYSKVIDSKDNVILEQNFYGNQAIDSDSAWVINRMLRTVVTNPDGDSTAPQAQLPNIDVIGKTGTSNDENNLMFIGLTPNYVASVWVGRDDSTKVSDNGATPDSRHSCASAWKKVMKEIEDTSVRQNFTPDPTVLERSFCNETGLLASTACEKTTTGYYRPSNLPGYCSGNHEVECQKIQDQWTAFDDELRAAIKKN